MAEPVFTPATDTPRISDSSAIQNTVRIAQIRSPLTRLYSRAKLLAERHEKGQIISESFHQAAQRGGNPTETSHPSEFNFNEMLDPDNINGATSAYITCLSTAIERYRVFFRMCLPDHELPAYHDFMGCMKKEGMSLLKQAKQHVPDTPVFEMSSALMPQDERKDPLCLSLVTAFQGATAGKIMLMDALTTCLSHEAARAEYLTRTPIIDEGVTRFTGGLRNAIDLLTADIDQTENLQKMFVRYIQMRPVLGQDVGLQYH
ncbi:MAG: hypothetical protein V4621_01015 [Pseudomonadota bacterium]